MIIPFGDFFPIENLLPYIEIGLNYNFHEIVIGYTFYLKQELFSNRFLTYQLLNNLNFKTSITE
jgi:hypothetical protein